MQLDIEVYVAPDLEYQGEHRHVVLNFTTDIDVIRLSFVQLSPALLPCVILARAIATIVRASDQDSTRAALRVQSAGSDNLEGLHAGLES